VNRFVLAALSAGLPHTVDEPSLVSANALSTTAGAVVTVIGGVAALGALQAFAAGNGGYATLAACSALPYVGAAAVVAGFARPYLGPDHMARSARLSARDVVAGMVAGARHAWSHPPAAAALTAISLHRLFFGFLTLMTLLLYRNTFAGEDSLFPGGLVGLGEVVGAGAVGTLLAAAVTPSAVRHVGKPRWITVVLAGGGLAQLGLGLPFAAPSIVAAGLALGFVAQAVKICVDTTLQEVVDDDFRGRVFSVYDTLFNVTYVVALLIGAFVLPPSGISYPMLIAVGLGYALTAVVYARITARH
jgi:hypothetical protein